MKNDVITRAQLRAWGACDYDARIPSLVPEEGLTPLEVCDLPIPSEDRLWILLRPEVLGAAFSGALADIVQRALDCAGVTDPRSRDVVAALREGRAPDRDEAERAVAAAEAAWAAAKAAKEEAWAAAEAAEAAEAEAVAAAAGAALAARAAARAAGSLAGPLAAAEARAAGAAERSAQLDDVRRALGGAS